MKKIIFLSAFVFIALVALVVSCSDDSESSSEWTGIVDDGDDHNDQGNHETEEKDITLTVKSNYPRVSGKTDEEKSYTYKTSKILPAAPFECTGYVFIGYGSNSLSTTIAHSAGDSYFEDSDTTLYALWGEKMPLTITFNVNAQTPAGYTAPTQELTLVKAVNISYRQSQYADSTFVGTWSALKGFEKCDSIKLDAQDFSLTDKTKILLGFALSEANATAKKVEVSNGAMLSLKKIDDTLHSAITADDESLPSALTIWAVWAAQSDCAKVIFNGNGGLTQSGERTTEQYFVKDNGYYEGTLDLNPFTKENYIFKGWGSYSDSTSAFYEDGTSLSLFSKNDITLYAIWAHDNSKEITITFDYGLYSSPRSITQTVKKTATNPTLTRNTMEKDGYVFAGWATSSLYDAKVVYKDGATIDFSKVDFKKDLTLYPVWHSLITITFYGNGGKTLTGESSVTQEVESSADVKLKANSFSRANHCFTGWSENPYSSTATYDDEGTVNFLIDTTLYAVWEAGVTITINGNQGKTSAGDSYVTLNATRGSNGSYSYTLPATCPFTLDGYIFMGYSTASSYTKGMTFADISQTLTTTSDKTYYAIWAPSTFTITFDPRSGTLANTTQVVPLTKSDIQNESVAITLNSTKPSYSGYIFTGYDMSIVESGERLLPGTKYNFNFDPTSYKKPAITLYARWSAAQVSLNYYMYKDCGIKDIPSKQTVTLTDDDLEATEGSDGKYYYALKTSKRLTVSTLRPLSPTGLKDDGNDLHFAFYFWTTKDTSRTSGITYYETCAGAESIKNKYDDHNNKYEVYNPGDSISITGNTTLYPVFVDAEASDGYCVTYDNNSGGVNNLQTYFVVQKPLTGSATCKVLTKSDIWKHGIIPSLNGYLGWSKSKTATSASYTGGETITITGNTTLWAVW